MYPDGHSVKSLDWSITLIIHPSITDRLQSLLIYAWTISGGYRVSRRRKETVKHNKIKTDIYRPL